MDRVPNDPIRVLIVDDHPMFAEGLQLLLRGEDDITVVGVVGRGEEAIALAERSHPQVALVDIDLPGMDGIQTTERLRDLREDLQVVIITAYQEPEMMAKAVGAGACGFVPKTSAADTVADVIRQAAAGQLIMPERSMRVVLGLLQEFQRSRTEVRARLGQLTNRETETLRLVAEGCSTGEIAQRLFISPSTVQSHVKSILSKLGVHSKLEALTFAVRHGLIELPSA
jgi:two-component system, NarL family, response regulator LiaR